METRIVLIVTCCFLWSSAE